MKRFLTISLAFVILVLSAMPLAMPVLAAQDGSSASESDVYVVSSDTKVIGPPLPAPEPPRPIAAPEPVPPEEDHTPPGTTPRPEWYPMPDAVWLPKPEPIIVGAPRPEPTPPAWEPPEEEPISWCNPPEEPADEIIAMDEETTIIAVERVLPCPPEPVVPPEPPVPIAPPEPVPPEEPADEIIVAALPPRNNLERGCTIYCTLEADKISISVSIDRDDGEDLDPKLFVFDMVSCQAKVVEPTVGRYFEVERPRGTRLFLAVFDSEGVIYKITVWTPPSPSAP